MNSTWTVSTARQSLHGHHDDPASVWPDVFAAALALAPTTEPDEPVRISVGETRPIALFPARDVAGDIHIGATRHAWQFFLDVTTTASIELR